MQSKIMVLGWDSCDFDLLLPWVDQGHLPTVRTLIEEGRTGRLLSVYPPVTASAWSTIITGKNAGKHGIYEFASLKNNSYDAIPLNASNRKGKDLWEILSENGKKVAIIGVPMTFPVRKVNGVLVSGFLTPNDNVDYTYPVELKKELIDKVPGYETNPSYLFDYAGSKNDYEYIDALFEVLDRHIEGTKYIAKNKEWDFFMGVFNETDWVQHKFWAAIDGKHQDYTHERADRYGDIIREVYIRLDKALAELIEIAGPSTHLMLISDHGVGPQYKKFITNNFLYQIGLLKLKRTVGTASRMAFARTGISPARAARLLKTLHLPKPRNTPSKNSRLIQSARSIFISKDDIDWQRTKAFAPYGSGQIFINRKGYFPNGIVDKSEYEILREEIRSELFKIRNQGINVVEKVFLREELFRGEDLTLAPDIQFHCSRGYFPVGSFFQGATGIIVESKNVSGAHSMNGILILREEEETNKKTYANPPALNPNRAKVDGDPGLVDIVPTILHLANVPVPLDLDGESLASSIQPVKYANEVDTKIASSERTTVYTEEEQEDIENRLRSLGYE
jgi:predicted AlkP superfamily phosphohydrolase/phosphomutase